MKKMFENRYELELKSADTSGFLDRLSASGVTCEHARVVDDLTICFQVCGKHMRITVDLAKRLGFDLKTLAVSGPIQLLHLAKRRAALLLGIIVAVILTIFIPTRILFVEIEGNTTLDKQHIMEQAELVGIYFGAARKSVRSEKIKNGLLQAVPELKWAGINTYGCRAVISVTEREHTDLQQFQGNVVQGLYAVRDGIISELTVTRGTPLCRTGQAVSAGQLLISGYTDCGLLIRAEQAQGIVKAVTHHKIDALVAGYSPCHSNAADKHSRWSVQFGKKRIKLYNSSGNLALGCGKINETFHLTLPGGFQLPVSVVKETILIYKDGGVQNIPNESVIEGLACNYIVSDMVNGKILSTEMCISADEDIIKLTGRATCEELIGILQNEGIDKIDS